MFEIEKFQHSALKDYFDQDAMLYPVDQITLKVEQRDFTFFLGEENFLKVVDTLEKYQKSTVDVTTKEGRDFIVFKRQLYQVYEIQNRSIEEHEDFSFEIERENLKWLSNSHNEYLTAISRDDHIDDLDNVKSLAGKVYKRKFLDEKKIFGFGYFGLAGLIYGTYPHMVMHMGSTATLLGICGASVAGMFKFAEKDFVNAIEFIKEGPSAGALKVSVSTGPFTSKDLIVDVSNVRSVIGLGNTDPLEGELEPNVICMANYTDVASGALVSEEKFLLLPTEAFKDVFLLEWILSIKGDETQTDALFNDVMVGRYETIAEKAKGVSKLSLNMANSGLDNRINLGNIDQQIERDSAMVDDNLVAMQKIYSKAEIEEMSPQEFYDAYKKFVTGEKQIA